MTSHRPLGRRLTIDAAIAIALSLLLVGQTLALSWQPAVGVSTRGRAVATFGVAITGKTIHIGFEEAWGGIRHAVYRRSTDGGVTLSARTTLSASSAEWAQYVDVAVSGTSVDAVWIEAKLDDEGQPVGPTTLRYRRSTDSGKTWRSATTLGTGVGLPRVERSGSTVLVSWTELATGRIYIKRSTNGGSSFLTRTQVGTTTCGDGPALLDGYPTTAFGTAVAYVVFMRDCRTLAFRRSTDGGGTWSTAAPLATNGTGWYPQVAATGSKVMIGYAVWTGSRAYPTARMSSDKGLHWAAFTPLAGSAAPDEYQPVLGYGGGAWYAAFEACASTACTTSVLRFRSSTNGTTWTAAERVSTGSRPYNSPVGVGYAGGPVVVWDDHRLDDTMYDSDVLLRRKG